MKSVTCTKPDLRKSSVGEEKASLPSFIDSSSVCSVHYFFKSKERSCLDIFPTRVCCGVTVINQAKKQVHKFWRRIISWCTGSRDQFSKRNNHFICIPFFTDCRQTLFIVPCLAYPVAISSNQPGAEVVDREISLVLNRRWL